MTLQQPVRCAVALDIGRKHAGIVLGFGNTAAQASSFVSSVVFGYLVQHFGSDSAPFVPMVALLAIGTSLWTQIDPTREIFTQADSLAESDQYRRQGSVLRRDGAPRWGYWSQSAITKSRRSFGATSPPNRATP